MDYDGPTCLQCGWNPDWVRIALMAEEFMATVKRPGHEYDDRML